MLSPATARHKAKLVDPMSFLRREAAVAVDEAVARGLTSTRFVIPFGTHGTSADLLEEEIQALGYVACLFTHEGELKMMISWKLTEEETNEPA